VTDRAFIHSKGLEKIIFAVIDQQFDDMAQKGFQKEKP